MRLAVVILAMIVVISGLIFYFVIRRIRKQIDEMAEVLEDIKNGNGFINPLNKKQNEKEHCCRKLENEQNPSGGYCSCKRTE